MRLREFLESKGVYEEYLLQCKTRRDYYVEQKRKGIQYYTPKVPREKIKKRNEEILQLYRDGLTQAEIAKDQKLTRQAISYIIKKGLSTK